MTTPLIIKNLSKIYHGNDGPVAALKDVSLTVNQGQILGLLGPNGAGKSTLINILGGVVKKDAGNIAINGIDAEKDPIESRRHIGIVPQELNLDPFFNPIDSVMLQGGYYGLKITKDHAKAVLDFVGLGDKIEAHARSLSGGMRRRLMIAKAIVHNLPLLILDEPTAGVDISLRKQLWDNVRLLNKRGTTIILTTHYLEEAEELCDEIAIINHGALVTKESTQDLMTKMSYRKITFTTDHIPPTIEKQLQASGFTITKKSCLEIHEGTQNMTLQDMITLINQHGLVIHHIEQNQESLEDIFLKLVQ